MAGTAVIKVGLKAEASPLVPFLILFDVSVRVKGDPYPIAHPTARATFCNKMQIHVKHSVGENTYNYIGWKTAFNDFVCKMQINFTKGDSRLSGVKEVIHPFH